MSILKVEDLHTYFQTKQGIVKAVNGVSYSIEEGKTVGIVGESGSGKSVCAMSIVKLFADNGYIASGRIIFDGQDIVSYNQNKMNTIRGKQISVIFQEPMTSLNPVLTIKHQIAEVYQIHEGYGNKLATEQAIKILKKVRIQNPEMVAKSYAHQLSGGMRQRVMIAMALACQPKLLIADEPTTALDVTVQAQILALINELKETMHTSVLFITHDLGVIHEIADEVIVMYCGQVVEQVRTEDLFEKSPWIHPYTEGLLACMPTMSTPKDQRLVAMKGTIPSPLSIPIGCKFSPRCPYACPCCYEKEPELVEIAPSHKIRCFAPHISYGGKRTDETDFV